MFLRIFWLDSSWLVRLALLLAVASAGVHLATFVGLQPTGPVEAVFGIHVAVMALLLIAFLLTGYQHWLTFRRPDIGRVTYSSVLRRVGLFTAASAIYALAFSAFVFIKYGQGGPEIVDGRPVWMIDGAVVRQITETEATRYVAASLGIFSAWWFVMSMLVACMATPLMARLRVLRQMPRRTSSA